MRAWSKEDSDKLLHLITREKCSIAAAAARLGRTESAAMARLMRLRGKRKYKRSPNARGEAPYLVPKGRKNDCRLHLKLVAQANDGKGFPAYVLPPTYRVAA